ncbi:N-methyl-D-aspartate receptor NMDAR2C subunit [Stenomitos frigidus]|uniref:N-methyl-D-aspartate receptor NMDAR2C subunit n=1 Tax=Stenomitos frigidus ULC18 TaxID=2107698 RepID=A0A2T1E6X9_9CYAN|nr:N-methyl-D-aspartate receptor NMDAR2C subunit [Stenomitos frigidus]PSB28445.1 N-methyl-D-aspartate receptor NMDAR2C subunit [Stenomitos frigidus ULC18]
MLDPVRFQKVWQHFGGHDGSALFTQLLEAYLQPHRAYHTATHLEACLRQFDLAQAEAEHPAEVEVALWFHDAVYVPNAVDNEAQSALWATQRLQQLGVSAVVIDRIAAMIVATKHDRLPEHHDCKLLLDIDLSILGQAPEPFDAYEQCIRREYAWVPKAQYCTGRAAILERFLQRSTIYYTSFFRERLEAQARQNLERSLTKLRGQQF